MAVDQNSRVLRTRGGAELQLGDPRIRRLKNHLGNVYRLLTERPLSLYAAAFMRIGYGLLFLVHLVREFPHRHQLWGPQSPWTPDLARQMFDQTDRFSLLVLSSNGPYFEACYAVGLLTSLLFMLGWRTRAVSILFAIVVISFSGRNVFILDGGDSLTVIMAVYLVFTACGRRCSLDARRARQRAADLRAEASPLPEGAGSGRWAQARVVRRFTVTVLHNCAMVVVLAQMCILYGATGLYKVQGDLWRDGTALHYVLNLDSFRPWPALSDFVDSNHLLIGFFSYLTVLVQVAFPFTLFSKLKYVVLVILMGMHLGIAVLMGLVTFSAAMIIADAAFLPDRFFRWLARMCRRTLSACRHRPAEPALDTP